MGLDPALDDCGFSFLEMLIDEFKVFSTPFVSEYLLHLHQNPSFLPAFSLLFVDFFFRFGL